MLLDFNLTRLKLTIHLALAGAQSGYSVTWGTVTTNFDGGSGRITLNYSDGQSETYRNDQILNLAGQTFNGVASVEIVASSGWQYGYSSSVNGTLDDSKHEFTGITANANGFYGNEGSIILGADLLIGYFNIYAVD